MSSWISAKLIGVLVGSLVLLALVGERSRWMHRAHTAEAQEQADCLATRTASGLPKLKCDEADEQIAFLGQALSAVRTKTAEAKQADEANKVRVEQENSRIGQERSNEYEARIADARARAAAVVRIPATRRSDSGGGGAAHLSGVSASSSGANQASGEDLLPAGDALTATEQAIQLDELIKWVRATHEVKVSADPPPR